MSRVHENTLNVWLASLLVKQGLDARPESKKPGNRRLDIEVRIGPLSIAIEAEHGQSGAKQVSAIQDADARTEQRLALRAIAVCYPEGTTEDSLPTAQLIWTVRDSAAPIPAKAHWSAGNLEQLASVIRLTPAQFGDPDSAAAVLLGLVDNSIEPDECSGKMQEIHMATS